MHRVAVYARVSSEDQAERRTIENQLDFARKYVDLHQLTVVDWYADDGVTGTIPLEARPEGRRLLEDARGGKFETLLVYRLDRLGRSARVILNAVHDLEEAGVKVRSMTEPFDTGDPSGRFFLTILAGVADLERETILDRMAHGANRAAREGKWLGGIVPYGYRVGKDGYLEIADDPLPGMEMSEADVVRLIYRLIGEQKWSTIRVADYLNALGVPTSYVKDGRKVMRGKRKVQTTGVWYPSRIWNMVVSTTYKGIHVYGKRTKKQRERIAREVPAIVSVELWERAQQALKENQLEALRNARRTYLLRGLIRCGVCGLSYSGVTYEQGTKDHRRRSYYICNGKIAYRGPEMGRCPSKNIPADWLEEYVWHEVMSFIDAPGEVLADLVQQYRTKQEERSSIEEEKKMLEVSIASKEQEKQAILDLFRKGLIDTQDVEAQLRKIAQEETALRMRLQELTREALEKEKALERFSTAERLLVSLKHKVTGPLSDEERREIIKTLVDRIIVDTVFDERGRKSAIVRVRYTFGERESQKTEDVDDTVRRANNNFYIEETLSVTGRLTAEMPIFSGDRIRAARIRRGMTVEELSEKVKLPVDVLIRIEQGYMRPSIEIFRSVAHALGTTLKDLFDLDRLSERTFAEWLFKYRYIAGLSRAELAARVGVRKDTVVSWESGKHRPRSRFIERIEAVLGCSVPSFSSTAEADADSQKSEEAAETKNRRRKRTRGSGEER